MRMTGSWVAIATPYKNNGEVDLSGYRKLVDFHVDHNTSGLLVMGSTGESTMLSLKERKEIMKELASYTEGKIPAFMGCTGSTTEQTLEMARFAEKQSGTDGILMVVPAYVKPPQRGIYDFFKTVAEEIDLPISVYNNPTRVGVNIDPETIVKLAEIDNVVADKEAMPDVSQLAEIKRRAGDKIDLLCCDFPGFGLILPTLALGGTGTANVAGNVIPEEMELLSQPWNSWEDVERAREIYHKVTPLIELLYSESNPMPVKAALDLLGMDVGPPRRPLPPLASDKQEEIKETMDELGFLDKYSF